MEGIILLRIGCGLVGLVALIHAVFGRGFNRWGFYEFEDDSDVRIDPRVGRIWEASVGVALVLSAIFLDESRWF